MCVNHKLFTGLLYRELNDQNEGYPKEFTQGVLDNEPKNVIENYTKGTKVKTDGNLSRKCIGGLLDNFTFIGTVRHLFK